MSPVTNQESKVRRKEVLSACRLELGASAPCQHANGGAEGAQPFPSKHSACAEMGHWGPCDLEFVTKVPVQTSKHHVVTWVSVQPGAHYPASVLRFCTLPQLSLCVATGCLGHS